MAYSDGPGGGIGFLVAVFFLEPLIIVVESFLYSIALKDAEGKKRPMKSFIYGVTANIFSILVGFLLFVRVG